MDELKIIERNGQRVLTTAQLAESYGTENKIISNNFNRNKDRYTTGKHFFLLEGEELKEFRANHQIDELPRNLNKLYLWTEKGAWLHAKSLNTDEAWDAYESLVDEYYKIIQEQDPITLALEAALETRKDVKVIQMDVFGVKADLEELKDNLVVTSSQAKAINKKVREKVYNSLGGEDAPAFATLKSKVFSACWREFKDLFDINEFRDLPRIKFGLGMHFLCEWEPNSTLKFEIKQLNGQGSLF